MGGRGGSKGGGKSAKGHSKAKHAKGGGGGKKGGKAAPSRPSAQSAGGQKRPAPAYERHDAGRRRSHAQASSASGRSRQSASHYEDEWEDEDMDDEEELESEDEEEDEEDDEYVAVDGESEAESSEDEEEDEEDDEYVAVDGESEAESSEEESGHTAAPACGNGSSKADQVYRELMRQGAEPAVVGPSKKRSREEKDDGVELELYTRGAAKICRINGFKPDAPRRTTSMGFPGGGMGMGGLLGSLFGGF
eukprot:TRINITY_DN5526_c2_g3_i1.p1 TRINITY_DN5526_c2_g3~~TRINITY_DN5526_c2_g3_i1.p1  ORF type:complete len:249 (+),score=82.72 TRINITY_DN5526_c2_g3_i1:81-827(+)